MSNLILDQGTTWVRIWSYTNPDGTPINLTGASAAFQIRLSNAAGTLLADLDSGIKGGVTVNTPTGTVGVTVSATISSAMVLVGAPQGSGSEAQPPPACPRVAFGTLCVWGIELTLADTTKPPFDEGDMVITPEIVR